MSADLELTAPHPRSGLLGVWDRLAGRGATRRENLLNAVWTLLFTAGIVIFSVTTLEWTALQLVVVALFALDLAGEIRGQCLADRSQVVAPTRSRKEHLGFVLFYVHLFVSALLFTDFALSTAAVMDGALLTASLGILITPHDHRLHGRPARLSLRFFSSGGARVVRAASLPRTLRKDVYAKGKLFTSKGIVKVIIYSA